MTDAFATDVLIVGAGAAGLTLAIDLARRGVAFRLIDRNAGPFPGSRGKGLQPRTLEVFEDLGVIDRIAAAGGPYPPQRHHARDGGFANSAIMQAAASTPAEPFATPLMLPQFATEAILRDRLTELGHGVEWASELTAIDQDGEGVWVHLRRPAGEMRLRCRWLVGADGGRSTVRHALAIGFPGEALGVRAVVADVTLTGLSRDAWHRFGKGDPAQSLALCPLAGTTLFQLQAPIALSGDIDLSAAGLTAFVQARSGREGIVVDVVHWASVYAMSARLADRYRVGRAFLIGDAAHVHPPTGGQGLNTSVQDAYNLGWKLAAVLNGAPDRLLDSYEQERRPVAAAMLGMATNLLDRMKESDDIRRGRETRQLDIGYPVSPLCAGRPTARLRPGDRAPDAPLRGAAGQPRRLFDLFAGPHWTLIVAGGAAPAVRPGIRAHVIGDQLHDDRGALRAAYAIAPGERVLVRPDGYIGAILPAGDDVALDAYLAAVGVGDRTASPKC